MPGALDHHLHAMPPGAFGELAERFQLGELRPIRRIRQPARPQPIADLKVTSYLRRITQMSIPLGVHDVLFVVRDHPLREQRPAARDDADQAVLHERQMRLTNACVNRQVVHALLAWLTSSAPDHRPVEIFDLPADDHRVDRHGADRHSRILYDRATRCVQVAAGGEVHHGVRPPPLGPAEFFDFFIGARRHGRCAHVGVDFCFAGAADGHRVEIVLQVIDVGGDDHPPGGDFVANLRRR